MLTEFVSEALRVPFKEKGRNYDGWDCWGVAYCAYRDVKGVLLPSYSCDYTDTGDSPASRKELNELIASKKMRWERVEKFEVMDVALFLLGGQPIHVGLMIDKRHFLHCERKIGTVIEAIDSSAWKRRKEGVYRMLNICLA